MSKLSFAMSPFHLFMRLYSYCNELFTPLSHFRKTINLLISRAPVSVSERSFSRWTDTHQAGNHSCTVCPARLFLHSYFIAQSAFVSPSLSLGRGCLSFDKCRMRISGRDIHPHQLSLLLTSEQHAHPHTQHTKY